MGRESVFMTSESSHLEDREHLGEEESLVRVGKGLRVAVCGVVRGNSRSCEGGVWWT